MLLQVRMEYFFFLTLVFVPGSINGWLLQQGKVSRSQSDSRAGGLRDLTEQRAGC